MEESPNDLKSVSLNQYRRLLHRAIQILDSMSTSCERDARPKKIKGLENALRPLCNVLTFTDVSEIINQLYDETGLELTCHHEKNKTIAHTMAEIESQISTQADQRAKDQNRKLIAAKIKSKQWDEIYAKIEDWKNQTFGQKLPGEKILSSLLDACILPIDVGIQNVLTLLKTNNIIKTNRDGEVTYLYALENLAISDIERILHKQEENILYDLMEACICCQYDLADRIRSFNIDLARKDHIEGILDQGIEEAKLLGLVEDMEMSSRYTRILGRSKRTRIEIEPSQRNELWHAENKEWRPIPVSWDEMTLRALILLATMDSDSRPKTEEELGQTLQPLLQLLYVASPRAALTGLLGRRSSKKGTNQDRGQKRKASRMVEHKPGKIMFGKHVVKSEVVFPLHKLLEKISEYYDPKWNPEKYQTLGAARQHQDFRQRLCRHSMMPKLAPEWHSENCQYKLMCDAEKIAQRANRILIKADEEEQATCGSKIRDWILANATAEIPTQVESASTEEFSKPGHRGMETPNSDESTRGPTVVSSNPGEVSILPEEMETETVDSCHLAETTFKPDEMSNSTKGVEKSEATVNQISTFDFFQKLLSFSVSKAKIEPDFVISLLSDTGYLSLEEDRVAYNYTDLNVSTCPYIL